MDTKVLRDCEQPAQDFTSKVRVAALTTMAFVFHSAIVTEKCIYPFM